MGSPQANKWQDHSKVWPCSLTEKPIFFQSHHMSDVLSFIKYLGYSTYRNPNANQEEENTVPFQSPYVYDYRISYTNTGDLELYGNYKKQSFAICRFPKTITENPVHKFL
jgi:hypothetical protein